MFYIFLSQIRKTQIRKTIQSAMDIDIESDDDRVQDENQPPMHRRKDSNHNKSM